MRSWKYLDKGTTNISCQQKMVEVQNSCGQVAFCLINSDATPVQNLFGRPLEETLEVQLRYYGLNPEDFSISEDTSPSLLSDEQSRLLDLRLYEDLTPKQAYTKCLDYLTELGLL